MSEADTAIIKHHDTTLIEAPHRWRILEALIPTGHTLDDVLEPTYFGRHVRNLDVRDHLICWAADRSWRADLVVMGIDVVGQEVLTVVDGEPSFFTPHPPPPGYSYEFVNEAAGWRIMREGMTTPLRSGFKSALHAAYWLRRDLGFGSADPDADPNATPPQPARTNPKPAKREPA